MSSSDPDKKATPERKKDADENFYVLVDAVKATKRPPPPVFVPPAVRSGGGMPSGRTRDLNIMLKDLGLLRGAVTAYYGNGTRNAVSLLQQRLIADKRYDGRPDGSFNAATRAALIAHPDIPTTE